MKTLLFLFALVVASHGDYRENLGMFLHDFNELAKEHIFIENVSNFTSPSAALFYVRIEMPGKVFHASLRPHFALFHPDLEVHHRTDEGLKKVTIDQNEWLEGELMNEPGSRVLIHLKESVVTGTILTAEGDKYYIEPSHRHVKEAHDFHMISYKHTDVKFNITGPDGGHFCGHESHTDEKVDASQFMFSVPPKKDHNEGQGSDYIHYRKRRASDEDVKNRCGLALIGDYKFYTEVNDGQESAAVEYMIGIIQQVDPMYQTQSLDPDGGDEWKDYGFLIQKIEVIMTQSYPDDTSSYLHTPTNENDYLGVSALLKSFAYGKWDDHCLAHLFTNYDFSGGVLGLAYVASSAMNRVGGVCTKTYKDGTGQTRYLNVGLTTCQNYGRSLLTSELIYVTGHEFGHNWGSSHDSDTSTECAPKNDRYLMYPAAVDGSQGNNNKFSPCSKQAINDVLVAKSDSCFVSASAAVCNNGYVEEGEECDAGEDTDCCVNCQFTSGATCEPLNSDVKCCVACQLKVEGTVCRDNINTSLSRDCVDTMKCSADGQCNIKGDFVDGVACYDNGLCSGGTCKNSCEQKSKVACLCSSGDDICKICCQADEDSPCEPLTSNGASVGNLTDGKLCGNGHCNQGICEIGAQDIQERIWELMDEIDVNMVLRWFKNNIVFTIIIFTSIFWIPISIFVDWLDDKYDLGVLDDILGSSSGEKQIRTPSGGKSRDIRLYPDLQQDTGL